MSSFDPSQPRNHPTGKGRFSERNFGRPEVQVVGGPRFVAPKHEQMDLPVTFNGENTTYGKLLEELNVYATVAYLKDGATMRSYRAVYGDGQQIDIPTRVKMQTNLPDATSPLEVVNTDLQIAERRQDALRYAPGYGMGVIERREHDSLARKIAAATAQRDELLRKQRRDALLALPTMEKLALIDNPDDVLDTVKAETLCDDRDLYVVRSLAGSRHRDLLGAHTRAKLIAHHDETVRANFLSGNNRLTREEQNLAGIRSDR